MGGLELPMGSKTQIYETCDNLWLDPSAKQVLKPKLVFLFVNN